MGTGRAFHLKRSLVNPPAVDEATSLWYEIVIPSHSSSPLTLLQPIFDLNNPSTFYRCQPLPLTGQLQTGLRQDSALRALLLLLRAAARLSAADQRATSNCHPHYVPTTPTSPNPYSIATMPKTKPNLGQRRLTSALASATPTSHSLQILHY